jgi:hypothetical protein
VGREPRGKVLATYVTRDCKDGKGAPFEHPARVFRVKDPEGFEFLVVAATGYDSLVIRNHHDEGSERVFQAVLDSNNDRPVMHDYRLPKSGDGRMAVAFSFSETESSEGVFRGKVTGAAIACRLSADPPDADAGAVSADAGTTDAS